MRLLHSKHDHVGVDIVHRHSDKLDEANHPPRVGRQHLPLHRLPQYRQNRCWTRPAAQRFRECRIADCKQLSNSKPPDSDENGERLETLSGSGNAAPAASAKLRHDLDMASARARRTRASQIRNAEQQNARDQETAAAVQASRASQQKWRAQGKQMGIDDPLQVDGVRMIVSADRR